MSSPRDHDVLVVPYFHYADTKKRGGFRKQGDLTVVSAAAGPRAVEGLRVNAIYVHPACFEGLNDAIWADELIDVLIKAQHKAGNAS